VTDSIVVKDLSFSDKDLQYWDEDRYNDFSKIIPQGSLKMRPFPEDNTSD